MPDDPQFEKYLERRAEQLGLPTDPAAYQDGGLAVATTAGNVQQADFLAAMLQAEDIPAWVEGGNASTWCWHMQYAMHPGGVRVLVPTGRLNDAQAFLAQHEHRGRTGDSGAEPEPQEEAPVVAEEPEDPGHPLYRRARGLAYLLLIGPLYPVIFVLECILLVRIHYQRKKSGWSHDLGKARRIALLTFIYLLLAHLVIASVFLSNWTRSTLTIRGPRPDKESALIEKRISIP